MSRDFNRVEIGPLDTTLTDYRIDYPFYREDVGDIAQGALGQTSLPLNYFRRPQFFDFSFASPYYAYTYNMENVPFYNTKRPMIRMNYAESGQKRFREENFGIMHAQNISPTTGFNIDYKARGTRGQYVWSRTKNHNLSVAISHTGKRYSVHAGYYNNHIEQQENGGVVGEWAIADTTFEMPSGVPMRLADAEAKNLYRNNAFFVTQSYGIPLQRLTESDFSMANLSAVYIGHSFEYSSWSKVYTDKNEPYINERAHRDENGGFVADTLSYYQDWFINPAETRDSIYERNISNRFFRAGAALGPERDRGNARRRHRYRHAHLLAIRTERLSDGEVHEGQQDELLLLRLRQRKDKEICRLGRKPSFLPVGIQRRRPFDRRAPRAERLSPRTPPDSRRPVLDGPPFAELLAGESIL